MQHKRPRTKDTKGKRHSRRVSKLRSTPRHSLCCSSWLICTTVQPLVHNTQHAARLQNPFQRRIKNPYLPVDVALWQPAHDAQRAVQRQETSLYDAQHVVKREETSSTTNQKIQTDLEKWPLLLLIDAVHFGTLLDQPAHPAYIPSCSSSVTHLQVRTCTNHQSKFSKNISKTSSVITLKRTQNRVISMYKPHQNILISIHLMNTSIQPGNQHLQYTRVHTRQRFP